jgi:hypothetical protein
MGVAATLGETGQKSEICEITHSGASCLTVTNRITPVPRAFSASPPHVLDGRGRTIWVLSR